MKLNRSLSGYFCDDIRHEVNGKVSLIGCYNDAMLVESFPLTLPKMCAQVRVVTDSCEPFKSLKLLVLQDDNVLLEGEIPVDHDLLQSGITEFPEGKMLAISAQFVMSPLTLESPCILRVRAIVDGVEIRGLGLGVLKQESLLQREDSAPSHPTEQPTTALSS